jgi:hypothetical protein
MMFAVVDLSAKLGQVTGKGQFAVIRENYPRWILCSALIGVLIGNAIEAGVDIGGRCEKETLSNIASEMGWVADAAQQLICNQQVVGSSPTAGSQSKRPQF